MHTSANFTYLLNQNAETDAGKDKKDTSDNSGQLTLQIVQSSYC